MSLSQEYGESNLFFLLRGVFRSVVITFPIITELYPHSAELKPDNVQGYYDFRIVGGAKWEAFQDNPESVAEWNDGYGGWKWKGAQEMEQAV